MSFDAKVVPDAALMRAEPGAIDRDSHLPPTKEHDDQVHHLPDVFDGESGHTAMDDTVSGNNRATGGEALAVFHVGFDAVVGLVQSYFEETSDGDGLRVVSFPSSFVGLPW
jgi:hypothetical protein